MSYTPIKRITRKTHIATVILDTGTTNEALTFKLEVRNLQFDLMNQVCAVDELTGAWNRHAIRTSNQLDLLVWFSTSYP